MIASVPVSAAGVPAVTPPYAAAAPAFDRHRALPDGVPQAIRSAILAAAEVASPRLLDLGAGTGRIGEPFGAAGDDYVAVDLSLGMLREFACRGRHDFPLPRLAQADGQRPPFPHAPLDAVMRIQIFGGMLIQIFGGMRGWRHVIAEARRVLRPRGALVTGRSIAPAGGVDAQMKLRTGRRRSAPGA